jgi:hypothetical protein
MASAIPMPPSLRIAARSKIPGICPGALTREVGHTLHLLGFFNLQARDGKHLAIPGAP